jgi:hypothetical protein
MRNGTYYSNDSLNHGHFYFVLPKFRRLYLDVSPSARNITTSSLVLTSKDIMHGLEYLKTP